jgi:hypothetical protein
MGRLEINNEEQFKKDLVAFIDALENQDDFNQKAYENLISYGINKTELDAMIERIHVFASYDDDNKYIGFPYEDWYERLLWYYSEEDKKNTQYANRFRRR